MSAMPESLPGSIANDADPQETREWLDALSAVIGAEGGERAHFLLEKLIEEARQNGVDLPFSAKTGYVNTIEPADEEHSPGNLELEGRLRAYMRWNAMALVVKANRLDPADGGDLGGHISSFASVAHMFAAGFNHFWHAESEGHGGDLLYIQGNRRQGHLELSAPEADARVLAVPHGVDGPWPADGHLPGPLPEVPACTRHCKHSEPQDLGVLRRR
jgi:pyruvate dehydrogenase E1 component